MGAGILIMALQKTVIEIIKGYLRKSARFWQVANYGEYYGFFSLIQIRDAF